MQLVEKIQACKEHSRINIFNHEDPLRTSAVLQTTNGFHLQVSPSIQFLASNAGSVLCVKTLYDMDLFMDTPCYALPSLDDSSPITLTFHVSSMHANSRFYTCALEYSYPCGVFFSIFFPNVLL